MIIKASSNLHYPIRVRKLLKRLGDEVERSTRLFEYEYTTKVAEGREMKEVARKYIAEFQCEGEGSIARWSIQEGQTIHDAGVELVEINEPCTHETQYNGMCVICGNDMDEVNYMTTQRDSTRASITMVHGSSELKVSANEAGRSSDAAMRRLLKDKKLSLVVDLDQTIIHAVCDQTVAEWQKDETNPNHAAVKDVQSFELMDEGPASRPCSYFIKMRPGLREFLDKMSEKYELHIYTMGTRSYAQNVAKIIDPAGKIFGHRILSRDESGSMVVKSLHRLFPVDTKMVVIIDDRGDIWNWSPNLIRVKAFNFYVGIGDINSSFLPKLNDGFATGAATPTASESKAISPGAHNTEGPADPGEEGSASTTTIEEQLVLMAGNNDPSTVEEQWHQHAEAITSQMEDRPLLKKQEALDKQEEEARSSQESQPNGNHETDEAFNTETKENGAPAVQRPTTPPVVHRHPLLRNDDDELQYLTKTLEHLHDLFFHEYEQRQNSLPIGRVAELRGEKASKKQMPKDDLDLVPDIKDIVPPMKLDVLKGVVICFTGVIPQGVNHSFSDIGLWATSFGARVSPNLTKATTHVVADPSRRTFKVRQAAQHPNIFIVDRSWLADCFSRWQRVPEEPHIIEVEPDSRPTDVLPSDDAFVLDEAALSDETGPTDSGNVDDAVSSLGVLRSGAGMDNNGAINDEVTEDVTVLEYTYDEHGEPISPVDEINAADWEQMEAELKEFMGSDDESVSSEELDDEEDEYDSDVSGNSDSSKSRAQARKRKRPESGNSSGVESDSFPESDLQRRKKRAFERTSSLTKVQNAAEVSANRRRDNINHSEDELEKEMMRAMAEAEALDRQTEQEAETPRLAGDEKS